MSQLCLCFVSMSHMDPRPWAVLVRLPQEFQMPCSIIFTYQCFRASRRPLNSPLSPFWICSPALTTNLPTLCSFDGAGSRLTSHAFARLTIYKLDTGFRVVRLKDCLQINDELLKHLDGFPSFRRRPLWNQLLLDIRASCVQKPRFTVLRTWRARQGHEASPRAFSSLDVFTVSITPEDGVLLHRKTMIHSRCTIAIII
ncbi:hypothetical protein C8J56DRAFT_382803 [Mycena floridula]|nr:hypothetical protein C8J56DRAFT_382803 [Mycena floridula]